MDAKAKNGHANRKDESNVENSENLVDSSKLGLNFFRNLKPIPEKNEIDDEVTKPILDSIPEGVEKDNEDDGKDKKEETISKLQRKFSRGSSMHRHMPRR